MHTYGYLADVLRKIKRNDPAILAWVDGWPQTILGQALPQEFELVLEALEREVGKPVSNQQPVPQTNSTSSGTHGPVILTAELC